MPECDINPCPDPCESIFDRVVVSRIIKGGTRVSWELLPSFGETGPLTFTLQVGEINDANAGWEDVGLPVVDRYFAIDPEQRVYAKENWLHYRIKLETESGNTYYSSPVGAAGLLSGRDRNIAREILRQQRTLDRQAGQQGILLKRRFGGDPCPICLDPSTQVPKDPDCPSCYGTGYRCGFFYPIDCVWARLQPRAYRAEQDNGQGRGTIEDVVVPATMLAVWMLSEGDVWVNLKSDDRYFVRKVQNTAEWRGVPLICTAELRLIAFTSAIYTIEIPQQLQRLGYS